MENVTSQDAATSSGDDLYLQNHHDNWDIPDWIILHFMALENLRWKHQQLSAKKIILVGKNMVTNVYP